MMLSIKHLRGGDYITPNLCLNSETWETKCEPEEVGVYDKILGELPPESTKFEWPLYINLPFEGEYDWSMSVAYAYGKRDDIIVQQLANWLEGNKVLVNDTGWGIKTYEVCPPELYINGLRVTNCSRDEEIIMDYD